MHRVDQVPQIAAKPVHLSNETDRGLKERSLNVLAQGQALTRTWLRDALAVNNEQLGERWSRSSELGGSATPLVVGKVAADRQRRSFSSPLDGERNKHPAAKTTIDDLTQMVIDYRGHSQSQAERERAMIVQGPFVNTPKHGSWLNGAECELSCLTSQSLSGRRMADIENCNRRSPPGPP